MVPHLWKSLHRKEETAGKEHRAKQAAFDASTVGQGAEELELAQTLAQDVTTAYQILKAETTGR